MKPPEIPWLETQAKVTACKYELGAGLALAFGIPRTKHFRIAFSYHAHGQTYTGEFTSPTYIEQGATFPIAYNPLAPNENSKSSTTPITKTSIFVVGIIGSIILSLIWFAILRGCS